MNQIVPNSTARQPRPEPGILQGLEMPDIITGHGASTRDPQYTEPHGPRLVERTAPRYNATYSTAFTDPEVLTGIVVKIAQGLPRNTLDGVFRRENTDKKAINYAWYTVEYGNRMTDQLGDQAPARYESFAREKHEETMIQTGIMVRFDMHYLTTDEGQWALRMQLSRVADAQEQTIIYNALLKMQGIQSYSDLIHTAMGPGKTSTLDLIRAQRDFMFFLHKEREGGYKLHDIARVAMAQKGAAPEYVFYPSKLQHNILRWNTALIKEGGTLGTRMLTKPLEETALFNGLTPRPIDAFTITNENTPVTLFQNGVQIGRMVYWGDHPAVLDPSIRMTASMRDYKIHDRPTDSFLAQREIELINNCGLFDPDNGYEFNTTDRVPLYVRDQRDGRLRLARVFREALDPQALPEFYGTRTRDQYQAACRARFQNMMGDHLDAMERGRQVLVRSINSNMGNAGAYNAIRNSLVFGAAVLTPNDMDDRAVVGAAGYDEADRRPALWYRLHALSFHYRHMSMTRADALPSQFTHAQYLLIQRLIQEIDAGVPQLQVGSYLPLPGAGGDREPVWWQRPEFGVQTAAALFRAQPLSRSVNYMSATDVAFHIRENGGIPVGLCDWDMLHSMADNMVTRSQLLPDILSYITSLTDIGSSLHHQLGDAVINNILTTRRREIEDWQPVNLSAAAIIHRMLIRNVEAFRPAVLITQNVFTGNTRAVPANAVRSNDINVDPQSPSIQTQTTSRLLIPLTLGQLERGLVQQHAFAAHFEILAPLAEYCFVVLPAPIQPRAARGVVPAPEWYRLNFNPARPDYFNADGLDADILLEDLMFQVFLDLPFTAPTFLALSRAGLPFPMRWILVNPDEYWEGCDMTVSGSNIGAILEQTPRSASSMNGSSMVWQWDVRWYFGIGIDSPEKVLHLRNVAVNTYVANGHAAVIPDRMFFGDSELRSDPTEAVNNMELRRQVYGKNWIALPVPYFISDKDSGVPAIADVCGTWKHVEAWMRSGTGASRREGGQKHLPEGLATLWDVMYGFNSRKRMTGPADSPLNFQPMLTHKHYNTLVFSDTKHMIDPRTGKYSLVTPSETPFGKFAYVGMMRDLKHTGGYLQYPEQELFYNS